MPCRYRGMLCSWGRRGWSRGAAAQSCQPEVHLKRKKSNGFEFFSLSSFHFLTMCLSLSRPKSFPGDCAVSLSWTFITATQASRIIYSTTRCAVSHTLLIFLWVRGAGRGRGGCLDAGGGGGGLFWRWGEIYLNFPLLSVFSTVRVTNTNDT